jgi:hypothetical protein
MAFQIYEDSLKNNRLSNHTLMLRYKARKDIKSESLRVFYNVNFNTHY